MKTTIIVFLLLIYHFTSFSANEITVNATSGSTGSSYTTLKAAFDAINSGTHKGDITILVNASTTESSAMTLNYSGSGSASYTSVLIYPTAAGLSISGSISAKLISLNGADNVTIDGRVNQSGSASLTISNLNTSTSASTLYLYGDATYNTFSYCNIKGSTTSTTGGVIFFGTATTTGNDFNLINYCNICEVGANRPKNLIYSAGTSSKENSENIISFNNIYCFYGTTQCAGINVNSNSSAWIITNNSFYEDDLMSGISTTAYGIYINTGNGYNVSNNYIGGSAPECGGSAWTVNGTPVYGNFYAIYLNVGTTTASSVQNNTIKNIIWQSTNSGTHWIGIYINAGTVNVGNITGNNIGETIGNGSITIYNGANYGNAIGIYSTSTGTVNISNNSIGSFTFSTSSYASGFTGIKISPSSSTGTTTVNNNTIGSTLTANSINMNTGASSAYQSVYGIMGSGFSATGTLVLSNNTIANMYNNSAAASDAGSAIFGIYASGAGLCTISGNTIRDLSTNSKYNWSNSYGNVGIQIGTSQLFTVSNNTIYNLSSTNTGNYNTGVIGIYNTSVNPGGASNITRNRIYNLLNASSSANSNIYGINSLYSGSANFTNNQISLGTNVTGSQYIYGIYFYDSGPINFYYNSIYIGGSGTGNYSYAFVRYIWTAANNTYMKNNIFFNCRTGGSGYHYAIASTNSNPAVGMSAGYSNYNLMISPNANYCALWYYTNSTFTSWKTSSSCDANSWYSVSSAINAADLFTDPAAGNLNIKTDNQALWYVSGKGMPMAGYSDDYSSSGVRSVLVSTGTTDIGSNEFTPGVTASNSSVSGSHTLNGTETFTFAGRNVAAITWGSSGTLPTVNYIKYHIGINPNSSQGNYSNGYWEINTTGGSGFTYNLTLYYDPNMIGTISSEDNIKIAKSEDNVSWVHHEGSIVNTTSKTVTVSGLNSFSYFALSDASQPMPVTMNYFNYILSNNNVTLNWQTSVEVNNAGFSIERKDNTAELSKWQAVAYINGKGNSNIPVTYSYEDKKLTTGNYSYRIKQNDFNGNFEYFELGSNVTVKAPAVYQVSQSYPNPSNPNSKIDYLLPVSGFVTLKVYDMIGKEVVTLVNENKDAGYYTVDFNGSSLASGVYYYRLSSGNFNETKKMILVK